MNGATPTRGIAIAGDPSGTRGIRETRATLSASYPRRHDSGTVILPREAVWTNALRKLVLLGAEAGLLDRSAPEAIEARRSAHESTARCNVVVRAAGVTSSPAEAEFASDDMTVALRWVLPSQTGLVQFTADGRRRIELPEPRAARPESVRHTTARGNLRLLSIYESAVRCALRLLEGDVKMGVLHNRPRRALEEAVQTHAFGLVSANGGKSHG